MPGRSEMIRRIVTDWLRERGFLHDGDEGMRPDQLNSLLFRMIAYKIQANAFGDLDRETARYLDQIARDYERRRSAGERRSGKNPPPIPPVSNRCSLKPGTILAREHGGVLHRVIVGEGGFRWNDTSYKSLSERPFLQRLLADIENGLLEVVVAYKIDRLSHLLMDYIPHAATRIGSELALTSN